METTRGRQQRDLYRNEDGTLNATAWFHIGALLLGVSTALGDLEKIGTTKTIHPDDALLAEQIRALRVEVANREHRETVAQSLLKQD